MPESILSFSKKIAENPVVLIQCERELTIAGNLKKPIIKKVFKNEPQLAFVTAKVIVNRFLNSFAFVSKLTDEQIDIMTVDALDNFSYETLGDLILFLKMVRQGKFGSAKRGVDGNLLFGEYFPKYMEIKSIERERNRNNEINAKYTNPFVTKQLQVTYARDSKRRNRKEFQKEIDATVKNFDRQMLEDMIFDWEKDPKRRPYVNELKKKRKEIK